eukprot:265268_1
MFASFCIGLWLASVCYWVVHWIYKHNTSLDYKAFCNKNVIITGASTGIGKQMALELAKGGANIIITGLEDSLLSSVAKTCKTIGAPSVEYIALDLSTTTNCRTFTHKCLSTFKDGTIDYLFLNHLSPCPYEEWINMQNMNTFDTTKSIDMLNKTMSVNMNSHVIIATLLYEYLERSQGQLVYVSSLAGYIVSPYVAIYGGCKHAMSAFFENWRTELEIRQSNMGITICILSLVATKSALAVRNILPDSVVKRAADPNLVAKRIIAGAQKRLQIVYAPFVETVAMIMINKISATLPKWITCKLNYGRCW